MEIIEAYTNRELAKYFREPSDHVLTRKIEDIGIDVSIDVFKRKRNDRYVIKFSGKIDTDVVDVTKVQEEVSEAIIKIAKYSIITDSNDVVGSNANMLKIVPDKKVGRYADTNSKALMTSLIFKSAELLGDGKRLSELVLDRESYAEVKVHKSRKVKRDIKK